MIELAFDHLGMIVKSIDKEISVYEKLGYVKEGEIFCDLNQKMRGLFMVPKNIMGGGNIKIELIEDLSESGYLKKLLNSQCGKIYHIAYKVNDMEKNLEEILNQLDAKILSPIKDGEYYKKVCFLFLKNTQIIELVEYK